MNEPTKPTSIVVGIDGSRTALNAALWAIDEAVTRDIPLRLLYAVEPDGAQQIPPDRAARKLAIAENAVRYASMAIEAEEKPVRIEVEIAQEHPATALIRASASAAMVCVGAVGLHHFRPDRAGSTAAAVAASAHCPVAVIRGHGGRAGPDAHWIVVEPGRSADTDAVLSVAVDEARLRKLPLRAVGGDGQVLSDLNRRLERWRRRYPDVEVEATVSHESLLHFLAENSRRVGLVIVGVHDQELVNQLMGPEGSGVLHNAHCSVLIADHQHL